MTDTVNDTRTTRDRLLDATVAVIESGGEAAVRVRDVASACGVTTPIIYRHFGSRDGLIVAAQAERYRRSHVAVAERITEQFALAHTVDDFKRAVLALLRFNVSVDREPMRRMRAGVMGSAVTRPELMQAIHEVLVPLIDTTVAALGLAKARGLTRPDLDVEAAAWWYVGQIEGRLLIEATGFPVDAARWDESARRAVFALVFGDDAMPEDT